MATGCFSFSFCIEALAARKWGSRNIASYLKGYPYLVRYAAMGHKKLVPTIDVAVPGQLRQGAEIPGTVETAGVPGISSDVPEPAARGQMAARQPGRHLLHARSRPRVEPSG